MTARARAAAVCFPNPWVDRARRRGVAEPPVTQ